MQRWYYKMKKTLMNKNTVIMTIEYNPKYNTIDKIYEINSYSSD